MSESPTLYSFRPPKKGLLRLVSNTAPLSLVSFETGDFVDRSGVVLIVRERAWTILEVFVQGRVIRWTYERRLGDRTLRRVCREFLAGVTLPLPAASNGLGEGA